MGLTVWFGGISPSNLDMIDGPEKAAPFSVSASGEVADEPESPMSIVVKDGEGNASGVLQKWASEEWIYADCSAFIDIN
mgnify:CR=1 FL=1